MKPPKHGIPCHKNVIHKKANEKWKNKEKVPDTSYIFKCSNLKQIIHIQSNSAQHDSNKTNFEANESHIT